MNKELERKLYDAAKRGDIKELEGLTAGADEVILNEALGWAASFGHPGAVEYLMSRGAKNVEYILLGAAAGGHIELINLSIELGAKNYENALNRAAGNGQIEAMDHLRKLGAKKINTALYHAADSGNVDAVKYLVKAGAEKLDEFLIFEAKKNNLKAVKCLVEAGAKDLDGALASAANHLNLEAVKYLISAGAKDFDRAVEQVMEGNAYKIVQVMKYLVEVGAKNSDCLLSDAALVGDIEAMEVAIRAGAKDLEHALYSANDIKTIQYLLEKGAKNLDGALMLASARRDEDESLELSDYLIRKGAKIRNIEIAGYDNATEKEILADVEELIETQKIPALISATNSFVLAEGRDISEADREYLKDFINRKIADLTPEEKVIYLHRAIQISKKFGTDMIFNRIRRDASVTGDVEADIKQMVSGIGRKTEENAKDFENDGEIFDMLVRPLRRQIQLIRNPGCRLVDKLKSRARGQGQESVQKQPRLM